MEENVVAMNRANLFPTEASLTVDTALPNK